MRGFVLNSLNVFIFTWSPTQPCIYPQWGNWILAQATCQGDLICKCQAYGWRSLWKGCLYGPLLPSCIPISSSKTTSKLGNPPLPSYIQAKPRFRGLSLCLSERLQLILQLILQQALWLIKSKQRAFNPIHGFFFSIVSSLSNTIRFRMQSREEAGVSPTCLAGL